VLYETLTQAEGGRIATVDSGADFHLPAPGLVESGGRLVFVASPNSPSGTAYLAGELAALALALADEGRVLVPHAHASRGLRRLRRRQRGAWSPSTTTWWSCAPCRRATLAGLRVGLLFAQKPLLEGLRKVKGSYSLDRLAIVAAAAAPAPMTTAPIPTSPAAAASRGPNFSRGCLPSTSRPAPAAPGP
jgi:histidinol-phosphate aminotransferase